MLSNQQLEKLHLTPIEIQLSRFIRENPELILTMSIPDVQDKLFISKSAIHRFCRKLSLNGWNDLKSQLARQLNQPQIQPRIDMNLPFTEKDSPVEVAESLSRLYEHSMVRIVEGLDEESLIQSVALMNEAEMIDIYCAYHNQAAARNFMDKLNSIGRCVHIPDSFESQRYVAQASSRTHTALLLSYSGTTGFLRPIIQLLKQKDVPMILVTSLQDQALDELVNVRLRLGGGESLIYRLGQFSSDMEMRFMLDILFGCLLNQDRQKALTVMKSQVNPQISGQTRTSYSESGRE